MARVVVVLACVGLVVGIVLGARADEDFRLIVTKADNLPILGLIVLLVFFTWLGLSQGRKHDRILAEDDGDRSRIHDEMCD